MKGMNGFEAVNIIIITRMTKNVNTLSKKIKISILYKIILDKLKYNMLKYKCKDDEK